MSPALETSGPGVVKFRLLGTQPTPGTRRERVTPHNLVAFIRFVWRSRSHPEDIARWYRLLLALLVDIN
jgi:hypothetical protein